MINCLRCNKEFKFNYLLVRHNNRKYPCKQVEEKEATRSNEKQREATRSNEKQLVQMLRKRVG